MQNTVLESTLQQLKETESQLVQTEKIISLGRLSAGGSGQIQEYDTASASDESLGGGAPQSRGAAGDDGGRARDLHELSSPLPRRAPGPRRWRPGVSAGVA